MGEPFTSDLLFIVIVLLVAAILGFLIGYLLKKKRKVSSKGCPELENEIEKLKSQVNQLLQEKESGFPFNAEEAKEAFGTTIMENDLKIIEGIGEKIAQLLNNKEITSWKLLSEKTPDELKEILLNDGGERYRIHNPGTWPLQAKLAYEGNWLMLKNLQDNLKGGVTSE